MHTALLIPRCLASSHIWTSHDSAHTLPSPEEEDGAGMEAMIVQEEGAVDGGMRDRIRAGAQVVCAVQRAEAGDTEAVRVLAHPRA